MKASELKNFETPDKLREFSKGRVELVKIGAFSGEFSVAACPLTVRHHAGIVVSIQI